MNSDDVSKLTDADIREVFKEASFRLLNRQSTIASNDGRIKQAIIPLKYELERSHKWERGYWIMIVLAFVAGLGIGSLIHP